jgi:hypothetical protein
MSQAGQATAHGLTYSSTANPLLWNDGSLAAQHAGKLTQ